MNEEEKKKKKRQIEKGIVAGITSASVLLGGTFDSPQDLINEQHVKPKAVIEQIGNIDDDPEQEKQKSVFEEKLRDLIYRIPVKVRMFLCVPLWFLGTFLISLTDLLANTLLAPIGHIILNFVLHVLLLLAVIGICVKILFPDMPWSKIFNKRTLLLTILGSILLSLCDIFMPMVWEDYRLYRNIAKFVLGLTVILIILRPFLKKKWKERFTYEIVYEETFAQ